MSNLAKIPKNYFLHPKIPCGTGDKIFKVPWIGILVNVLFIKVKSILLIQAINELQQHLISTETG